MLRQFKMFALAHHGDEVIECLGFAGGGRTQDWDSPGPRIAGCRVVRPRYKGDSVRSQRLIDFDDFTVDIDAQGVAADHLGAHIDYLNMFRLCSPGL